MSESNLKQVKKLTEQLSSEEFSQLFKHLAGLQNSGLKTLPLPVSVEKKQISNVESDKQKIQAELKKQPKLVFSYNTRAQNGEVIYSLEGIEVFSIKFNAGNCSNVFFQKLKSDDSFLKVSSEQRQKIFTSVREILTQENITVTDEQIEALEKAALRQIGLKLLKESIENSTKQISQNLPQVVVLIFDKIFNAALFSSANDLRDTLNIPEQKYKAKEIKEALFKSDWEILRIFSGVSKGGANNTKHLWTDKDRTCLANNYERLKPIWAEAKRIAISTQKARESARSQKWQEAVLAIYPDLPTDLIERFIAPRSDDAKPADLALIHSARLCIPVSYSTKRLRNEIKSWKFKNKQ